MALTSSVFSGNTTASGSPAASGSPVASGSPAGSGSPTPAAPVPEPAPAVPAVPEAPGSPDGTDAPTAPAASGTTPEPTGADRPGFAFTAPREKKVAEHVAALRRESSVTVPCWPKDLVKTVPAATALSKGDRPVLVIFYDDTARASRLSAAELWPVVLEIESRVDLVLVDLTPGSSRPLADDERRLVRRYYLGYVPTTVVLSSDRTARLLKSERVDPAVVRAAANEAK